MDGDMSRGKNGLRKSDSEQVRMGAKNERRDPNSDTGSECPMWIGTNA